MGMDVPKVLVPLRGKPLIRHCLGSIAASGLDARPVVVVGHQAELVKQELSGESVDFVEQVQQLGTGHAVAVCKDHINPEEDVLVYPGDHALISPQTLASLAEEFDSDPGSVLAMVTHAVADFSIFDGQFQSYGRILRDKQGDVKAIREAKDASPEELAVKEVNLGLYVFNGPWLWENIKNLSADNAQSELYITDLIEMAINQGKKVISSSAQSIEEAIGVNTPQQLAKVEQLISRSKLYENHL